MTLPLDDAEIDELRGLLEAVPAPLDPLDVASLDGFLCGVVLQPARLPVERWLSRITDVDGRPLPAGFEAARLHALARRRHAELEAAIGRRRWFDPWVFADADADDESAGIDAVYPWVAGIATAFELFPDVMELPPEATLEPLAMLYRHLDADDLEDADDLLEAIDSIEPPADLAEAVEGLVRATLLLADATRPLPAGGARSPPGRRRSPSG